MLANGTTLSYKTSAEGTYTELTDLKTVPDMNNTPEKVENTGIAATNKQYEIGVGDYGDLEYTFKHSTNSETSVYRTLRPIAAAGTKTFFKETWTDGTTFEYEAVPAVGFKRAGGINSIVDLVVTMALQSNITVTDPT